MAFQKLSHKFIIKIGYAKYVQNPNFGKWQPLLIHYNGKNISLWRITTKYLTKSKLIRSGYFPLFHWHPLGLNYPSYVDVRSEIKVPILIYKRTKLFRRPSVWYLNDNDSIQFCRFIKRFTKVENNLKR